MRESTPHRSHRTALRSTVGAVLLSLLALLSLVGCGTVDDTVAGHAVAAAEAPEAAASPVVFGESRPTRLRIPDIDVDTDTFVGLGLTPDNTMEVPEGAEAVGWYVESPTPGEAGPSVLAAHVDWQNQKGVFFDLRNLAAGAEVIVNREDGSAVRFRINEVEQYPKDSFPTDKVYGDTEGAELRLITCGGDFNRSVQSYRDNVVAYGSLVQP